MAFKDDFFSIASRHMATASPGNSSLTNVGEFPLLTSRLRAFVFFLTFAFVADGFAIESRGISIQVSANGIERTEAIATGTLPRQCDDWTGVVVRAADGTSRSYPAQVSATVPRRLTIQIDHLDANQTLDLTAEPVSEANSDSHIAIVDEQGGYHVTVDGKQVLNYHHATVESPAGIDPVFRRSGYIHPLFCPSQSVLTDDFHPRGHTHQHGIMFAWTNGSCQGRQINFWEQIHRQGVVRHAETLRLATGPVFAEINVRLEHIDISTTREIPVLSEIWNLRVYRHDRDYFLFDLKSIQSAASDSPFIIKQYHYGGLAVRGRRDWVERRCKFLTSNGKTRENGNHDRANWCSMYGRVDGANGGVTVMCHPSNFRAPQPVRIHPDMPYFCFAPLVLGDFQIDKSRPLVSRYRFVAHDGDPDPKRLNQMWLDYAHPLSLTIVTMDER